VLLCGGHSDCEPFWPVLGILQDYGGFGGTHDKIGDNR
jgi:hypothetical protein